MPRRCTHKLHKCCGLVGGIGYHFRLPQRPKILASRSVSLSGCVVSRSFTACVLFLSLPFDDIVVFCCVFVLQPLQQAGKGLALADSTLDEIKIQAESHYPDAKVRISLSIL